jgi:hypothetical protein
MPMASIFSKVYAFKAAASPSVTPNSTCMILASHNKHWTSQKKKRAYN